MSAQIAHAKSMHTDRIGTSPVVTSVGERAATWTRCLLAIESKSTLIAGAAANLLLLLAVACGTIQVFARFVFQQPTDWTEVLTRFVLIWMVYLGTGVALRAGALVSVDLFFRMCSGRWKRAAEALIVACVLVFLVVIGWYGAQLTWRIRFQEVAGLEVSMSWAYLAIPVGAAFSAIAALGRFYDPSRAQANELETAQ